ncbi:hypothetical protein EIP86_002472 [Pleurotus ostreatoroseus]|nr:hypothetical protein EIP86_002472 [Pleurotus ostreatoroseus]
MSSNPARHATEQSSDDSPRSSRLDYGGFFPGVEPDPFDAFSTAILTEEAFMLPLPETSSAEHSWNHGIYGSMFADLNSNSQQTSSAEVESVYWPFMMPHLPTEVPVLITDARVLQPNELHRSSYTQPHSEFPFGNGTINPQLLAGPAPIHETVSSETSSSRGATPTPESESDSEESEVEGSNPADEEPSEVAVAVEEAVEVPINNAVPALTIPAHIAQNPNFFPARSDAHHFVGFDQDGRAACSCAKVFHDEVDLARHLGEYNEAGKIPWPCPVAGCRARHDQSIQHPGAMQWLATSDNLLRHVHRLKVKDPAHAAYAAPYGRNSGALGARLRRDSSLLARQLGVL